MHPVGSILLASLCCALPLVASGNSNSYKDEHVALELLAEQTGLRPGTRAWLGVKFAHEPHWHTYWMNSGDSGLPTRLEWKVPAGFRAGDIAWPAPQRFELGGNFNFGYEGTMLLPVPLDVPADAKPGTPVTLSVNARWVVCNEDLCIPGKATLQLKVPVAAAPAANANAALLFANARAKHPIATKWSGQATVTGDRVRIMLRGADLPTAAGLDVFPTAAKLINNTPPVVLRSGDRLILEAQKNDYFEAAPAKLGLVLTQGGKSWRVDIPWLTGNSSGAGSVK